MGSPDCVVCLDKTSEWAAVPCGHLILCDSCRELGLLDVERCLMCNEARLGWRSEPRVVDGSATVVARAPGQRSRQNSWCRRGIARALVDAVLRDAVDKVVGEEAASSRADLFHSHIRTTHLGHDELVYVFHHAEGVAELAAIARTCRPWRAAASDVQRRPIQPRPASVTALIATL